MQFHSSPNEEHEEAPLADDKKSECYVVSVSEGEGDPDAQHAEIRALVGAVGDRVVGTKICFPTRREPRTLNGRGAYESIAAEAEAQGADPVRPPPS